MNSRMRKFRLVMGLRALIRNAKQYDAYDAYQFGWRTYVYRSYKRDYHFGSIVEIERFIAKVLEKSADEEE